MWGGLYIFFFKYVPLTPQVCQALLVIQPASAHHSAGLVKLSLSHFIIRKAAEPSHSLRGKGEKKRDGAVGRLHYSTLAAIYSVSHPKDMNLSDFIVTSVLLSRTV